MATASGNASSCSNTATANANDWVNTGNGTGAPDNATAENDFNHDQSLPTDSLGFTVSLTIPVGATVTDVSLACYKWASGAGVYDYAAQIVFTDGGSNSHTSGALASGTEWATTAGSSTAYGGSATTLFGSNPVTAGGTNCTVGFSLQAYHPSGGVLATGVAYVDAIAVTVTYTPPPSSYKRGAAMVALML